MSLTNSISISSSTFALRARFAHILLMTHKKYVPAPSEITTMKKSSPPSILCSYEMPPPDDGATSSESCRATLAPTALNVAPGGSVSDAISRELHELRRDGHLGPLWLLGLLLLWLFSSQC